MRELSQLQLVIKDWSEDGALIVNFDYKTSDYTDDWIEQMWKQMNDLTGLILENASIQITDLNMVVPEEQNKLIYRANNTVAEYPDEKLYK
jgi:hypothetical protein